MWGLFTKTKEKEEEELREKLKSKLFEKILSGNTSLRSRNIFVGLEEINFPIKPEILDEWEKVRFEKLLRNLNKTLNEQDWFDVCAISDLHNFIHEDILKNKTRYRNLESYRKLEYLHCVKYDDIPSKLLVQVHSLISSCLNNDVFEVEIINSAERPLILK